MINILCKQLKNDKEMVELVMVILVLMKQFLGESEKWNGCLS